jgi:hypothetical protein
MKTKTYLAKLGTLALLCLLTFSARATVLLQDNFTYSDGQLTNVSSGKWALTSRGSASSGTMNVVSGQVSIGQLNGEDDNSLLSVSNSSVGITNILYVCYTANYSVLPTGNNGDYFTHFSGPAGFKARIFGVTNGAVTGSFRIGIANGATGAPGTNPTNFPVDLSLGATHTVVARLLLNNGSNAAISTLWIDPASESSSSVTATDFVASSGINMYGFRQPGSTSGNTFLLDNLLVGTTFADVVPGSLNPPTILLQPQDVTVFAGSSASFTNLAAGDATLAYQWYSVTNSVTNSIPNATNITLTLSGLITNQTGSIFCVITNGAGTNTTRLAALTVAAQPIPPTIDTNIMPTGSTNNVGDTVTFTIVAHGLPAPAYQWKFVPATNSLVTNIVVGATSPTLTLTGVSTNQAGSYFVTITNSVGYLTTNSALAVLKVNPPPFVSIAVLRSMVDNTYAPTNTTALYTIQGTVTTWTNMTTSTSSSEFYIQDASGGIVVFWSGAASSTNVPPAGAIVSVTGPLAAFSGLLEIEPVFTNSLQSVTIISTNNPLPIAQPLPFDPNITGNMATMKMLEGSYFVASNVTLTAGATFVSGANEPITVNANQTNTFANSVLSFTFTNTAGQTFTLFVNAATDISGKAKSSGSVTIYGVLGYFTSAGFEFTPSRYADVISYVHLTNIVSNARKGDLATNNYTELVVRPGEVLTTFASIGDAAGGSVTLTPTGTLPTGAYWTNIVNGSTATAVFQYAGSTNDAGTNFMIQLNVASTAGTAYTETFTVYVPTPKEQQIAITEFLANPTTNTSAPWFNPLQRSSDTLGVSTNDQYVEIANQSGSDITSASEFTLDTGVASSPVFDSFAHSSTLQSSNSLVIYGGNSSTPPGLSTPFVASGGGLSLPKTGGGVLVLRNNSGYIIDRVVYSAADLSTNGSLSRFPTINSAFVPQAYISTSLTTAGLQYDGGSWSNPTKVPTGVTGIGVTYINGQAVLSFPANTTQASTLWNAGVVTGPYKVIYGQPFPGGAGVFTNASAASQQFYFITTQ